MSQFHRISVDIALIRALIAGDPAAAHRIYLALRAWSERVREACGTIRCWPTK
jgi:hypothetical protein